MNKVFSRGQLAILIVVGMLILDQAVKIAVKTNMYYGESIHIADWFYIHFVENNGMAFGLQVVPKLVQTLARMLFAGGIAGYLYILVRARYKVGYIVCISSILAGAIGNIIDSIFYGALFSASTQSEVSTFVAAGSGYADWLYGKVVDMFYFPLFGFDWPAWVPFVGGNHFIFFSPVFNVADAAISCGVIALLLFYMHSFNHSVRLVTFYLRKLLSGLTK